VATTPDAVIVGSQQIRVEADQIPFATTGLDCPTIYADMIRGTSVQGEVAKISLIEHKVHAIANEVQAYHVANIVIPASQLRGWGAYFTKLADAAGLPTTDV